MEHAIELIQVLNTWPLAAALCVFFVVIGFSRSMLKYHKIKAHNRELDLKYTLDNKRLEMIASGKLIDDTTSGHGRLRKP